MSALVVRALKLEDLTKAMDEIKAGLPAGEIAEIANINSVRPIFFSLPGGDTICSCSPHTNFPTIFTM